MKQEKEERSTEIKSFHTKDGEGNVVIKILDIVTKVTDPILRMKRIGTILFIVGVIISMAILLLLPKKWREDELEL